MRTKTLLIAVAALAAGILASSAQTYSQNIVGYANVVIPGNAVSPSNPTGTSQYALLANPFDDGNGNLMINILSSALPAGSQVLTWTPGGLTFNQYTKVGGVWSGAALTLQLPPGTGFFVKNGKPADAPGTDPAITNTFVGSVVVSVGNSVTNSIPLGISMQGSPIPYAGNLAIATTANGDTNMNFGGPLTKAATISTWLPYNSGGQTYQTATKVFGTSWSVTQPLTVGAGFFVNNVNGPATNVVETLTMSP
jgi:hypothetical protein